MTLSSIDLDQVSTGSEREVTEPPRASERVPPAAWAIGAGVALAIGYTASPVSAWSLLAFATLFAWAGHGLSPRERRWVWSTLAVAVLLRILAVAVLFLVTDHLHSVSFFWDYDGVYIKRRSMWILNLWNGTPITPQYLGDAYEAYGWSQYLNVLAYLQYFTGPAPYGVHLFNIVAFVATAILLHRLARRAYGKAPAFLGFVLFLFLPTMFAWSISALKESVFGFLLAAMLVATVAVARAATATRRALALVVLGGLFSTIEGFRVGGRFISGAGLAFGIGGGIVARRVSLLLIVAALVPFAVHRTLADTPLREQIMVLLKQSAMQHIGNVRTEGHAYKLLDQVLYADRATGEPIKGMTPDQAARFVVRALVSFVLIPLPWQTQSASEMMFLPQQILWYLFIILAPFGIVAGLRRDALVTCCLLGLSLVAAATVALNSGNVGTMVRHRDIIMPFLIWLSALGAVSAASRWRHHDSD